MRGLPEEIPDVESKQVLARVCAIDVAKESGMVCTRLPGPRPFQDREGDVSRVSRSGHSGVSRCDVGT